MPLFTDGQVNTLHDLQRYESGILNVASAEQVDVAAKLALAQELVGDKVLTFLLKRGCARSSYFSDLFDIGRRRIGISDVVVTESLKRCHALKTIELIYEDAYGNQLNERYQAKLTQYARQGREAASRLFEIGIGLVWNPITKPSAPLLMAVAGSAPATDYYVRTTWVNAGNQESAASDVVALATVDGTELVVAQAAAPANAIAWNVYVGLTPDGVTRQNDFAIPAGSEWNLQSAIRLGAPVPAGQVAERYVVDNHVLLRG